MNDLLERITTLQAYTADLKRTVVSMEHEDGARLRDCVTEIESAIYQLERRASEARSASARGFAA